MLYEKIFMERYEEGANLKLIMKPDLNSPKTLMGIVKFTFIAALFAMFGDAIIAHAMLWGNDPYWTYWITDGLLMATVFGIGTSFFGVGLGKGAILTAVHIFFTDNLLLDIITHRSAESC